MNFGTTKPDNRILNAAYHMHKAHPTRQVILVSKDVNLRMKAKAVGLLSEDYRSDHVKDISSLYKGRSQIENIPDETLQILRQFDELEPCASDCPPFEREPYKNAAHQICGHLRIQFESATIDLASERPEIAPSSQIWPLPTTRQSNPSPSSSFVCGQPHQTRQASLDILVLYSS